MVTSVFVRGKRAGFIFWNISAPVGSGKANSEDDVELVRLGYFSMKDDPNAKSFLSEREKAALGKLKPKGGFAADLDEVIRAHEASRGGTQDGFVSVMHYTVGNFGQYDHKHRWIMMVLNTNLLHMIPEFPRIDLSKSAGSAVSRAVIDIMRDR